MSLLDKLEKKFGKYAIRNLMKYIIIMNAVVFAMQMFSPRVSVIAKLSLNKAFIMQGEVWRLITFIFIPPTMQPIFLIFALYLYYMIGNALENTWGSFKFNIYYLIGILGIIVGCFLTGYGETLYLNLSLFLAFACLYPDYELLWFGILPIKMKYMAIIDVLFLLRDFVFGNIDIKVLIILSLVNFLLFFWRYLFKATKVKKQVKVQKKTKKKFTGEITRIGTRHRCQVCGMTENDDPDMEFRYCSSCEGEYEYCSEHLKNHEHIKG
ncbi:Membrane associated serine protease, rhomboid family [Clostridium cavendishii DSM 21758]|uniref:Membrane associated serine protease, rhomboid family n=1 Tax=Clostridium cavendishii DSM 21758 TaxID=1121302 RepID=A0A1M6NTA6_9CLOT|nr:rhomboid family intramembrane serine protease [Clostridium cavendishii]SHJ98884.1 Membrane associated serine protease, rhomboid family [Clostridium cavendishii DSM 21758]